MKMLAGVEIQKMRKLADFLETVPPEDFDIGKWRTRATIPAIALGPVVFRRGCGFAGCAMGWAAEARLFTGLRINPQGDLCFRGATDYEAAATLFGVTRNQAWFLFGPDAYHEDEHVDPAHVSDRLRKFASIVERRLTRHKKPTLRLAVNN